MFIRRDISAGPLVVFALIACLIFIWISLRASDDLNWMFTFGYLAICVTLPLAAKRNALWTSVVMAPILMAVAAAAQTFWAPDSISAADLGEKAGPLSHFIAAFQNQLIVVAIGLGLSLAALGLRLAAKDKS